MNPIDVYVGMKALKGAVDDRFKIAEYDAADFFAEEEKKGVKSLSSPMFGDSGGEYKRGKTKAKTVVEYELADWDDFSAWLYDNVDAMHEFCFKKAEEFAKDRVERHGELPDGIDRNEFQEPPKETGPKLYRFDQQGVVERIAQGGNLFEKANELLLGDAE